MSSPSQLQRGRACHECRRRKLKCTAERPTCDNCQRAQNTSRGNLATKQCEYDCPREEEIWKHWSNGASGREHPSKRTSTPSAHPPQGTHRNDVEVEELQSSMICWPSAPFEDLLATPSYPTLTLVGPSHDNSPSPYLVNPNNVPAHGQEDFNIDTDVSRLYVSARTYSSNPAVYPGYTAPEVPNPMLFQPDQNQLFRLHYERIPQSMMDIPELPADLVYMQHSSGQPLALPRRTRSSKLPDHQLRFT